MTPRLLLLLLVFAVASGAGWFWYDAHREDPHHALRIYVRSGLFTRKAIIEIFSAKESQDRLGNPSEVGKLIDAELAAIREEQKEWPEPTEVTRLDQAFQTLVAEGVLCIQNVGYSVGDGIQEISEIADGFDDPSEFVGYCFFPLPALEDAVEGRGLTITYGAFTGNADATIAEQVLRRIAEQGLTAQHHANERSIVLANFDWKKRVQ